MFTMSGSMTDPSTGSIYAVIQVFDDANAANVWLGHLVNQGYTARLTCTVKSGAGGVTYMVTV